MTTLNFDGQRLTVTFPGWELLISDRDAAEIAADLDAQAWA